MKSNIIHETIIRDLIDLGVATKDNDLVKQTGNFKKASRSIAAQSANLTAVFPVLVSNAISLDTATMLAKATERKAVNMLQLLFAANLMTSKDGIENLQKYHNNIKIDDKITVDGVKDLLYSMNEGWYDEVKATDISPIAEDCKKNLGYYLNDPINESSVNDFFVLPKSVSGKTVVTEARGRRTATNGVKSVRGRSQYKKPNPLTSNSINKGTKYQTKPAKMANNSGSGSVSSYDNSSNYSISKLTSDLKNMSDLNRNVLVDTDVKKPNEMVPTVMQVRFARPTEPGNPPVIITHLIGVKAKLYVVDSKDILDRLTLKHQDKHVLTNFFKASTREISFMKDFLFAIKRAKVDALSQSRKGSTSKLWKLLERRAMMSKIKRSTGLHNDCMAITTLAITQEEVDNIKKYDNINLEDPSVIRPILSSLNLMGFVICDEINETAKFIYDTGEDLYEYYSYNSLEKEASDNSYKRMVKLMGQMGGR